VHLDKLASLRPTGEALLKGKEALEGKKARGTVLRRVLRARDMSVNR